MGTVMPPSGPLSSALSQLPGSLAVWEPDQLEPALIPCVNRRIQEAHGASWQGLQPSLLCTGHTPCNPVPGHGLGRMASDKQEESEVMGVTHEVRLQTAGFCLLGVFSPGLPFLCSDEAS